MDVLARKISTVQFQICCIGKPALEENHSAAIFFEHATASAPGPMWHATLKESGLTTMSWFGKSSESSDLNSSAISEL